MIDHYVPNEPVKVVDYVLSAGRIRRYHTVDGGASQSVGEHTFGVMALILLHNPKPSVSLLQAAMVHDVPEKFTGDIPAPAKWLFPGLRDCVYVIEEKVLERLGLRVELSAEDQNWLDTCDLIELTLYAQGKMRERADEWNEIFMRGVNALRERLSRNAVPSPLRRYLSDLGIREL